MVLAVAHGKEVATAFVVVVKITEVIEEELVVEKTVTIAAKSGRGGDDGS